MPIGLQRTTADVRAVAAAWSARGSDAPNAATNLSTLLIRRQLVIDTSGPVGDRTDIVLRTRLRLSGDSETDILRDWLQTTPSADVETLCTAHFRSVAATTSLTPVIGAVIRLATDLAILMGTVGGIVAIVRDLLREGWRALGPALLANWGLAAGVILAMTGMALRILLRTWLRQKLRALFSP
ncbi:MAG TPA: hypothetical protein VFQ90_09550 [Stellaceae bacterium]|jgi:hypothetical protein|nr:hypothetical protein [Stellaceae bacterium]